MPKTDPITQASLEAAADDVDKIPLSYSEAKALYVGMANMITATYGRFFALAEKMERKVENKFTSRTSGPSAVVPLLPCKSDGPFNKTVTVDPERFRTWLEELTATKLEGGLITASVTIDGYLQVTFEGRE